jgi:hypothetical protein
MNPEIWMVVQRRNIHFRPIAKIGDTGKEEI